VALACISFAACFIISSLYISRDRSLPYWDTVHYGLQAERFAKAVLDRNPDWEAARELFKSAQPPGYAIPMIPFYLIGGVRWEITRLAFCCFYGPLAVVGVYLLTLEFTGGNRQSGIISAVCCLLTPLFWFDALRGMADIAGYAITPWIIWFWVKSEHCSKKTYCAGQGLMLGWGMLCRRRFILVVLMWCFICAVDLLTLYLNRHADKKKKPGLLGIMTGLAITILASVGLVLLFCPVRYFSQFYDPSNATTLYLFHISNLFYAKSLPLSGLGPPLAIPAFFAFIFAFKESARFWPLISWAGLFYIGTEFLLSGQEERNTFPMFVPLFVLIGWLFSNGFQCRFRKVAFGWMLVAGLAQLIWGLTGISFLGSLPAKMSGVGWLSFPPSRHPTESLVSALKKMNEWKSNPMIFTASSSIDLNWTQLLWLAETGRTPEGFKPEIHHADVPRNTGFPLTFPRMDFILLKDKNYTHLNPGVEYACDLIVNDFNKKPEERVFLRNFEEAARYPYGNESTLFLLRRTRNLEVEEELALWKALISADTDNFFCIQPRIWLISCYASQGRQELAASTARELLDRLPVSKTISRIDPALELFGASLAFRTLGMEDAILSVRRVWDNAEQGNLNCIHASEIVPKDWSEFAMEFGESGTGQVKLNGISPVNIGHDGISSIMFNFRCIEPAKVAVALSVSVEGPGGGASARIIPNPPMHMWRKNEVFNIIVTLPIRLKGTGDLPVRLRLLTDIGDLSWKTERGDDSIMFFARAR